MNGVEHRGRRATSTTYAVLLLVLLLVSAAITVVVTRAEEDDETVLRIGFTTRVDSLNPFMALTDSASVFFGLVYDALHTVGGGLETEPNLALDWGPVPVGDPEMVASGDPYGSVWEFDITRDAHWHDGNPLTAEDVVFTVNLSAQNYNEMWSTRPYAYFIDYAEAIDENTVRIHFSDRETGEPVPVIYADSLAIPILPMHLLRDLNSFDIAFTWRGVFSESDPPIVGSGPFMVTEDIYEEWVDGHELTLVRNPDYHWGHDKDKYVHFDKIVMYFNDDTSAMALALKTGELDVAQFSHETYRTLEQELLSGELDNIDTDDGLKCTQDSTAIFINSREPGPNPFRFDPAVRQALAMATDKAYVVDNIYYGLADEGSTLISPVNEEWHYEPTEEEKYHFDLEAASQLLEDAGYFYPYEGATWRVVGEDSLAAEEGWALPGEELRLEMTIGRVLSGFRDFAEYLANSYEQIGIELVWRISNDLVWPVAPYDMEISILRGDPDPNAILFAQSARDPLWNDHGYANESYDDCYSASVMEFDSDVRGTYVDDAQRVNYLDAYCIVLAYPYRAYAWRTDTFMGWGDWTEEPCRSIDAHWGANPLYFDLQPVSDGEASDILGLNPPTFVLAISAIVGTAVVLALVMLRPKKRID